MSGNIGKMAPAAFVRRIVNIDVAGRMRSVRPNFRNNVAHGGVEGAEEAGDAIPHADQFPLRIGRRQLQNQRLEDQRRMGRALKNGEHLVPHRRQPVLNDFKSEEIRLRFSRGHRQIPVVIRTIVEGIDRDAMGRRNSRRRAALLDNRGHRRTPCPAPAVSKDICARHRRPDSPKSTALDRFPHLRGALRFGVRCVRSGFAMIVSATR